MSAGLHVAIAIIENDRVLLLRQAYGEKLRSLLGGGVEPDETPDGAAVRKACEEAALGVRIPYLVGVYVAPERNMISF